MRIINLIFLVTKFVASQDCLPNDDPLGLRYQGQISIAGKNRVYPFIKWKVFTIFYDLNISLCWLNLENQISKTSSRWKKS